MVVGIEILFGCVSSCIDECGELGHQVEAWSWGMELGQVGIGLMRSIQKYLNFDPNFDPNFLIRKSQT